MWKANDPGLAMVAIIASILAAKATYSATDDLHERIASGNSYKPKLKSLSPSLTSLSFLLRIS